MTDLLLEPLRLPYMQRAMAEVLLLGVLTGAAGVFVVLRRLAFMTDALTHTVFPGVVIAHLAGWSLAVGALAFGVLTAVLLTILAANRRVASDTAIAIVLTAVLLTSLAANRRVASDAAIAIVLTALFSVGVLLVSRQRSYTSDLTLFLFGRILTVDRADLLTTLALTVVVLTALAVIGKELLLRSFDPEGATAMGYPGVALDLALNLLIALVVVAAVKAVGTVLVVAMLIVPAASARLLAGRVAGMTVLACLFGVLAGWGGLLISYHLSVSGGVRLAAGATIVVVLVAGFLTMLAATAVRRWRSQPPRLAGSGGAGFAPSVDQAS